MDNKIKEFEDTLNTLLSWEKRKAIELDCKNIDLKDFGKKQKIVNELKEKVLNMYKEALNE